MAAAVSRMICSSIFCRKVFQLDQPMGGVNATPLS